MKHTTKIVATLILSAPLALAALPSANAQQSTPARIFTRPTGTRLSFADRQRIAYLNNQYFRQMDQLRFATFTSGVFALPPMGPTFDMGLYGFPYDPLTAAFPFLTVPTPGTQPTGDTPSFDLFGNQTFVDPSVPPFP